MSRPVAPDDAPNPPEPRTGQEPTTASGGRGPDQRVVRVHRIGALVVAATIAVFGVLGFAGDLGFFSTEGQPVMGMSANGLLSTISLLTAAVLVMAAARSGRLVSTVMMVVGVLFLLSAFGHLFVLDSDLNVLAFRLSNVFFSIGAGLLLLLLGTYGRVTARLPADNPYYLDAHSHDPDVPQTYQPTPRTPAEAIVDETMAEAERASAQGYATADQRLRVADMSRVRTPEDRRRVWLSHEPTPGATPVPGVPA